MTHPPRAELDESSENDGAGDVEALVTRALDALEPGAEAVEKAAESSAAEH